MAKASPRKPRSRSGDGSGSIEITQARGWVTATIVRPSCNNRFDARMGEQLKALCEFVEDDESVHAMAVTGSGAAFCEGFEADVDVNLVESFAAVTKPTVAILNGDARDEGLELAMAADIRVAMRSARFALTQPGRGAMPRFGATQRLPRLVGIGHALRILLSGNEIDGAEALEIGLVTYLANNRRELARRTGEVAQSVLSRAPVAARLVKEAVRKGYDMTLDQGIRLEEDLYALLQTTSDRSEGVQAFLEKRRPLFRGA